MIVNQPSVSVIVFLLIASLFVVAAFASVSDLYLENEVRESFQSHSHEKGFNVLVFGVESCS